MDKLETELKSLIDWLTSTGRPNVQQELKKLEADDVPLGYRRALSFFKSLSGPSRELFVDVACGRRVNKPFLKKKKSASWKSNSSYKPTNSLTYTPKK